ncbi:DUF3971 domain-containing protein [Rhizobium sp. CG5]|uniref:DUF3971 domain-containing protein n=1 Tax=Rhizobium sp. CG5 TaxID=2726076 RepID=UPI002033A664
MPLHHLPSAQIEDPLIVHCPARVRFAGRAGRFALWLVFAAIFVSGLVVLAVETGSLDRTLSNGARSVLQAAIGPKYRTDIGSTAIRFSKSLHLALEVRNVSVIAATSGEVLSRIDAVRLVLDPVSLLRGRVSVSEVEAEGLTLDASLLPKGGSIDLASRRIDEIPAVLEAAFVQIDGARDFIARGGLDSLRIGGVEIAMLGSGAKPLAVSIDDMVMRRSDSGALLFNGQFSVNGHVSTLTAEAQSGGDRATSLNATLSDVHVTPFLLKIIQGKPRQGLDGKVDIALSAGRGSARGAASLSATVKAHPGQIYVDGDQQELTRANLNLAYDFTKQTIELRPSLAVFGQMRMPFTGGLIDLDRLPDGAGQGKGIGIDFLVNDGLASVATSGETPIPFSMKAYGRYLHGTRELQIGDLTVATPSGRMTGTVNVRFGDKSPEIRFNGSIADMHTSVVKQMWPYWMAMKPRAWVMSNLYGGTITQGSIEVFLPAGRLPVIPHPLDLDENELKISFDIVNARMNIAGDIPPIRDTAAHFDLKGQRLEVNIASGTSYFPSGRTVRVDGGDFMIANTYSKPLMADLKIAVSGAADAVAELVTFRPIGALERTGFKASDFSGDVSADVEARIGLINDQKPPPPDWKAHMNLSGVDLKPDYAGRRISSLDGTLDIDRQSARLEAKGKIDDIPMEVSLTEPVETGSTVERTRVIRFDLDNADRKKLAPGLEDLVDGPIALEIARVDDTHQSVKADLTRATVTLPWVGWSKGSGIKANTELQFAEKDGVTTIDNFTFDGDGFGAAGKLQIGKTGLISADLNRMRLSPADDYAVSVRLVKGIYRVNVSGTAADARPLLAMMKTSAQGAGAKDGDDDGTGATVELALDTLIGFNDETLRNVSMLYATRAGKTTALDMKATTKSGEAVVSQLKKGDRGNEMSVITSDAGALLRLTDLYSRMRGGLLDFKLRGDIGQKWNGSIDIRNFGVEDEERLQSIVSTPASADGQSLNSAVKRDIDVRSEKFQRAFARVIYADGALRTENGVVRGHQVGATFQGTVRDGAGNMDMTGTFMPAYGLNRLFAELPVIGILLGNGRDRGLLGITFKLTGPTETPKLAINPLSIIAPGVFRQIFEFQ